MNYEESVIQEKRVCDRYPCCGKVVFSGFNKDERIGGDIVNYGRDGMCILTDRPVKIGTGITIRLTGQIQTAADAQTKPRSMAVALVKRCQPIESDYSVRYRLGLKYLIDL